MTAERRTDIETERRLATLEEQRRADAARMGEYHQANQAAITGLREQIEINAAKMDLMLEAIHMAKGGWWAAGKIIGLILGVVSGVGMVIGAFWWAYQHISFKPGVAAAFVLLLDQGRLG